MNTNIEFTPFPKMARYSREMVISEKIDGTNASIFITDDGDMLIGSRTKWITPQQDNYGFAKWAEGNKKDLLELGPGMHFGEFWGRGIQRGYNMKEKVFSLFNVNRWIADEAGRWDAKQQLIPVCCRIVPVLFRGMFSTDNVTQTLADLTLNGSYAAPGFKDPEGIIIYHNAAQIGFKKTIKHDEVPKGLAPKE